MLMIMRLMQTWLDHLYLNWKRSNLNNVENEAQFSENSTYERYVMMNVKISSELDNMHIDDLNYGLKSFKNNELTCKDACYLSPW